MKTFLASLLLPILLANCGGVSEPGAGRGELAPVANAGSGGSLAQPVTLRILEPANATTIHLAELVNGSSYATLIEVTGFRLANNGSCSNSVYCGHARAMVDGASCNSGGDPYNAEGMEQIDLALDACPTLIGQHSLTIELRNDDGSVFLEPATGDVVQVISTFEVVAN